MVYDIRVKESKSGKNQSQRAKSKPSTPRIKRIARIVSCSSLLSILKDDFLARERKEKGQSNCETIKAGYSAWLSSP